MQMGDVNSPTGKNGHFDSDGLFIENEGRRRGQCERSNNGMANSVVDIVFNMDSLVFDVKTVNAVKLSVYITKISTIASYLV